MCPQTSGSPHLSSSEEAQIQKLYQSVIDGWNHRDSRQMAAGFDPEGFIIGFDGTHHFGQKAIEAEIGRIFADHPTPPFIVKIKRIRFLTQDVAQLEAMVGMIPPEHHDLDPKLHAYQVLTAVRKGGHWTVAHFQNTPAQLHGRPEEVASITRELNNMVRLG